MNSFSWKKLLVVILVLAIYCSSDARKIGAQEKKGFVFVANEGSASISVIDSVAMTVVDTVTVDAGPHNWR